jgi:TrmH family RNA methyltransferase
VDHARWGFAKRGIRKCAHRRAEVLAHPAARRSGGHAYGTFLDGEDLYRQPALSTGGDAPVVLVVGNESRGIGEAVSAQVDGRLFIPPFPAGRSGSESLNAAVAASLAIAEFRRRSR